MPDLIVIGGLQNDTPPTFGARTRRLVDDLEVWLDDLDSLVTQNTAFRSHLDGVGILDPGTALGLGVTGPCLRASGVEYDVRTAFPYASYHSLEVPVSVENNGDASARFRVRMAEMRASLHLIRQIVPRLSEGPVSALSFDAVDLPALPEGQVYASVEGSRGELGVYLVSHRPTYTSTYGNTDASAHRSSGATHLQRAHVRAPSFANLSALPYVARGHRVDQVNTLLDSLDISMGEVER
jgi:NADH-quinone oxidoreductase subunit D